MQTLLMSASGFIIITVKDIKALLNCVFLFFLAHTHQHEVGRDSRISCAEATLGRQTEFGSIIYLCRRRVLPYKGDDA